MKWKCPLCDYEVEKSAWKSRRDRSALGMSRSNHYRKHKIYTSTFNPDFAKLGWWEQDTFIVKIMREKNDKVS